MYTLILPGFSPKNKDWALDTKSKLQTLGVTQIIFWEHWQTGNAEPEWIVKETKKILNDIGDRKINIIAKSIGTLVAMYILNQNPNLINKLILCGIPMGDLAMGDDIHYQSLSKFPKKRLLCIQNENDDHGSFLQVKKFMESIDPEIKVISKARSDHEYPYAEDFQNFLT
jgi:pimeloyl-ACP methyl ester carboxylesterase